jgi:uncharacterized membrane protein (UPF0127 family)
MIRNLTMLLIGTSLLACDTTSETEKTAGPSTTGTPQTASSEPPFKKEGELWFLSAKGDTLRHIDIELAVEESERTMGLMHRRSLPDTRGMLFIFEEEEQRSFWMKNTLIGLDILYIRQDGTIESIAPYTVPKNERSIPSKGPAKFVLEVFEGFCDRYGVKEGDKIVYTVMQP